MAILWLTEEQNDKICVGGIMADLCAWHNLGEWKKNCHGAKFTLVTFLKKVFLLKSQLLTECCYIIYEIEKKILNTTKSLGFVPTKPKNLSFHNWFSHENQHK